MHTFKNNGFYHFGYNSFFEATKPRFETNINLTNNYYALFNNIKKNFRTKIRNADKNSIIIHKGNKTYIDCLSGTYGIKTLTLEYDIKTVLRDCSTSVDHESFSFYKWTEETGILGCGKNKLQLAIINYGLGIEGNIFTITSSNYVFIDFTV